MLTHAAGCSHAKSPSIVGDAKRGERINRAPHRTPRGGETQRRCHVVGVMRPAHTGMCRKAAAGIPATVSVIDFPG